jgi:hypothetical protein
MVEVVLRSGSALIFGVLLSACSDGGAMQTQDASVPDAGDDDPCAGHEVPDSGTSGTCNPVTGGRCNVANQETCVWSYRSDDVACVCSFGTVALEEECRTDRPSCAPGMVCLRVEGNTHPICHQVCDLTIDDACARLAEADPANLYRCAPIGNGEGTGFSERYGICTVAGTACNPLDDRCDLSESCGFLADGTGCIPAGAAAIGEQCTDTLCAKGGLCAKVGTFIPAECYQPCNLASPSCASGTCREVGYPFGLCI